MSIETESPQARVQHALAALELAAIAHRRGVRRLLHVGDEELSALLYLAHHGGVTQRQLGAVTGLSRSGAGAMIQRLEERGHVQRRTNPADRRLRLVELSPAGHEHLEHAYHDAHAATRELLEGRPPAELDALAQLLSGIASATGGAGVYDDDDGDAAPLSDIGDPIWRRWG
jgi:DNA-binding MarR family transcriptional regulator